MQTGLSFDIEFKARAPLWHLKPILIKKNDEIIVEQQHIQQSAYCGRDPCRRRDDRRQRLLWRARPDLGHSQPCEDRHVAVVRGAIRRPGDRRLAVGRQGWHASYLDGGFCHEDGTLSKRFVRFEPTIEFDGMTKKPKVAQVLFVDEDGQEYHLKATEGHPNVCVYYAPPIDQGGGFPVDMGNPTVQAKVTAVAMSNDKLMRYELNGMTGCGIFETWVCGDGYDKWAHAFRRRPCRNSAYDADGRTRREKMTVAGPKSADNPLADSWRELVDTDRLAAWMADQGLGSGPMKQPVSLGGGTQICCWPSPMAGDAVCSPAAAPSRMDGNATMRREMRALAALADTDVPHPRLLASCPDVEPLGAAFYLMEPIDGFNASMAMPQPHAGDPAMRHAMGLALIDGAVKLGRVDPVAQGLPESGAVRTAFWNGRSARGGRASLRAMANMQAGRGRSCCPASTGWRTGWSGIAPPASRRASCMATIIWAMSCSATMVRNWRRSSIGNW